MWPKDKVSRSRRIQGPCVSRPWQTFFFFFFFIVDPTLWQLLIASSTAGALGGFCGNPFDVVNARMQNDGQLPPQQRRNYKHAVDGFVRIAREEGAASLFRGLGPNMNRAILMTSSQCVSYDTFKDLLLRYSPLQDGLILHFTSSTLAVSKKRKKDEWP